MEIFKIFDFPFEAYRSAPVESFPGGKLGGGDLSPTSATIALATWVTFAVGMALLILGLSILVALVYFRY
uniref:Uncharacterized protein n=1 Tax=Romanomermis culicivorax TaxID=13658 RepID=A0A915KIU4_ROMCU